MKTLKFVFALIVTGALAFPAIAFAEWNGAGAGPGQATGDGDPPGWSQNNPGQGGSDGPGQGPKGLDDESAVLSCVSAIASLNPVQVLEACGDGLQQQTQQQEQQQQQSQNGQG